MSQGQDDQGFAVEDVDQILKASEGQACVPRFFEQYTPIAINHACFSTAERLFLASFDKEAGLPKLPIDKALEMAATLFSAAFDFERTKRIFESVSEKLGMPNIYEMSIREDQLRMEEEAKNQGNPNGF